MDMFAWMERFLTAFHKYATKKSYKGHRNAKKPIY